MGEYLEQWLEAYVRINVAPTTFLPYANCGRRHLTPALGSIPLTKLRARSTSNYTTPALFARVGPMVAVDCRPPPSSTTTGYSERHCSTPLSWQLLTRNPADAAEPPRPERREISVLGPEEVSQLFAAAEETRYGPLASGRHDRHETRGTARAALARRRL